jgi:putative transposase
MEKWKNQYRIPSARANWWDYSNNGQYFITICTHDRVHHFGEIEKGKLKMTAAGAIAQGFWFEIPRHFPFVHLGEFVVMPNHIHGIIIIERTPVETLQCNVSTTPKNEQLSAISPKSRSLPTIIRSYKSICTKTIRQVLPHIRFEWQERYWDHIIRDETAFNNISNYIFMNQANWEQDKFFGKM